MKRFLIASFIFLIWFCVGSWIYLCKVKAFCVEKNSVTERIPVKNTPQPNTGATAVVEVSQQAETVTADTTAVQKNETFSHHKILYFGFDSENPKRDNALRDYIIALKTYLNTYPDKKISITGHTDSVGETEDNAWIGMQRAKSAMKYLIAQGIPEAQILLYSKGETEPIAPNTTKDGRRRNRRVELMIN